MAVCEMRKVYFIGEKSLRDSVVRKLRGLSLFQPSELKEKLNPSLKRPTIEAKRIEENLSKLSWAIDYLKQFDEKGAILSFFPSKAVVKKEKFLNWIDGFSWEKTCKKCREFKERLENLTRERETLEERHSLFSPWKNLPLSLEKLQQTKYLIYWLGKAPHQSKENLHERIKNIEGVYLQIVKEEAKNIHFLIVFLKEQREKVELIFQELRIEKITFFEKETISEKLEGINKRVKEIDNEAGKIKEKLREINRENIKLMSLYDYFSNILNEKKVGGYSRFTSFTFVLEGWVKKEDVQKLFREFKNYSSLEIIAQKPEEKEEKGIPVALSNKHLFKSFELVTELYGIPRYLEIDPTPFLTPFFALFLAVCLTDGGYGIILALLAYLVPKKFEVGEGGKKLFSILFVSGLVTIGIGIITGGIFGVEIATFPSFLSPLKRLTLFNPLKQPLVFLLITLAVGVIHLLTGIILEFWENVRRGEIISAILDQASWIILIIGAILFGVGKIKVLGSVFTTFGLIMFLLGIGTLFFFSGRKSKSFLARFGKGAFELYGLIQLFGDVLSYTRLLALGLATSVIATAVNTIARMSSGIPLIGPVLMIVILIGGHLGNIGINCLSGFIHTARLQFVEFFGKFYEGGGKSFTPFRQEGKYTLIK
ncbi:MAG: V-type ATP synthase subunit I [Candidatus Aerophobetes bacterium]|nr:V-type ATP synthase subunit I [Candidatus Aerophobetes bacterium]